MTAGLCLMLGACSGDDSSNSSNESDNEENGPGGNDDDDDSSSSSQQEQQNQQNQQNQQESECSSPSECDFVVCDCPEGPVNFQGCSVFNGVGICATEDTCASSACE